MPSLFAAYLTYQLPFLNGFENQNSRVYSYAAPCNVLFLT
jgi:hypothetical protein